MSLLTMRPADLMGQNARRLFQAAVGSNEGRGLHRARIEQGIRSAILFAWLSVSPELFQNDSSQICKKACLRHPRLLDEGPEIFTLALHRIWICVATVVSTAMIGSQYGEVWEILSSNSPKPEKEAQLFQMLTQK
jgi:hypothetical protein